MRILLLFSLFFGLAFAQNLTEEQTQNVVQRLAEGAKQSWELGTRAQALLTHSNSRYSVYYTGDDLSTANDDSSRDGTFLPPPTSPSSSSSTGDLAGALEIASQVVGNRTRLNGNISGPQPLMKDGAAADPASIGVAVLLANWTGAPEPTNTSVSYAQAAQDQLRFLLEDVPRSSTGAISHRVAQVQLWSDFIYMVPPFLAYYGVLTDNTTLIGMAFDQISLYRDQLRDPDANGLWKHVLLGSGVDGEPGNDEGHWSTGNAWAASGMLRVLGTIQHSPYADDFRHQMVILEDWVYEIQNAMFGCLNSSTLIFTNYASDSSSFPDAASTALLASSVYRLALLRDVWHFLPTAERIRQNLFDSSSNHFTSDGWLTPVVNPHSYGVEGSESPEAQAFVLELQAAWGDWESAGRRGENGARSFKSVNWGATLVGLVGVAVGMGVL